MNETYSLDSSGHQASMAPFGRMTYDLRILLDRAQHIAQDGRQPLNTTHVLVAALDPTTGPLPTPLGNVIPEQVRRGWYPLALNHLKSGRASLSIESCLPYAQAFANGRELSAAVIIYAIVENDPDARIWLTSVYAVNGDVNELRTQLRDAAEDSLGVLRPIIHIEPHGQLRTETQRLLHEQKLMPTPLRTFAHAHMQALRNIATEVASRGIRGTRIPAAIGPKGSGVERFALALVEAPSANLPFSWPFEDTYCLNVARLFGSENAQAILEMAVNTIGPNSALVLTESRAFDRFTEDTRRAQECLDFLRREAPANVIVVYRTDDSCSLPESTRIHREIYQDFKLEPLDESETRAFVEAHFIPYWDEIDTVTVTEDAFDDVYPISDHLFEDDIHFNLPYLPIIMGTNAAQTVKRGQGAILALVEEAQRHLNAARSATKAHKSLDKAFARYFDTLQLELNALKANSDPRTSKGLPLVTRELVTAELTASSVYLLKWPEIPPTGTLASIVPVDYPSQ